MADFTVADVLAWARTKPAGERYSYSSNENCALCQFVRETGLAQFPTFGSTTWNSWTKSPYHGFYTEHAVPPLVNGAVVAARTFGDLVKRLEKLCPETPVTKSDWLAIDAYLTDIETLAVEQSA